MVELGLIRFDRTKGEETSCPAETAEVRADNVSILVVESKVQETTNVPDWHPICPIVVNSGGMYKTIYV